MNLGSHDLHHIDLQENDSMLRLVLIIVLFLLLLGMLPTWGYSQNWGMGYYPSGGLGLLLVIVLVLFLVDRRRV